MYEVNEEKELNLKKSADMSTQTEIPEPGIGLPGNGLTTATLTGQSVTGTTLNLTSSNPESPFQARFYQSDLNNDKS